MLKSVGKSEYKRFYFLIYTIFITLALKMIDNLIASRHPVIT